MTSKSGGSGYPENSPQVNPPMCGLVMPISAMHGYTAEHWADVRRFVSDSVRSITDPQFQVQLVSDAEDVGVLQKRIVQNLYGAAMIVCDVSGLNPNVMFELGLRLAFDKPTVMIKDDATAYPFDTGVIEHIPYARDLRVNRMVEFGKTLADKIVATYKAAAADANHSTFLKSFGTFKVAVLSQDRVPADQLVLEELSELKSEMARVRRTFSQEMRAQSRSPDLEGNLRLIGAVSAYLEQHPSANPADLMGDPSFIMRMGDACDARRHFESLSEFKSALETVLWKLPR